MLLRYVLISCCDGAHFSLHVKARCLVHAGTSEDTEPTPSDYFCQSYFYPNLEAEVYKVD